MYGVSGEQFFTEVSTISTPPLHATCWALSEYKVQFGNVTLTICHFANNRPDGKPSIHEIIQN